MIQRVFFLGLGLLIMALTSGCATTSQKKLAQENETLRLQVQNLEKTIEQKDAEIDSLRRSLSQTTEEKYNLYRQERLSQSYKKPTIKQIQIALKNAGFDPGPIDGTMGKKTRSAIREFQRQNGLVVDGKVGKKTWAVLSAYLKE
ncbi:MAG: peptidoglycan-binding protein [Candidatus Omnitrophica bacterium]|nr:peptidoglycan-binding protein [Candidatus Omnitrophota bacterium]